MSVVATATIETLTAEVRVLMVGSRQVTLSVFRQLDTVDREDIQPLGRVRDGKEVAASEIRLVGVSRADGTLVRSTVYAPIWTVNAPDDFVHYISHTRGNTALRGSGGIGSIWSPLGSSVKLRYQITANTDGVDASRGYGYWRYSSCPARLNDAHDHGRLARDYSLAENVRATHLWLDAEARYHIDRGDMCGMDDLERCWRSSADADHLRLSADQSRYDEDAARPLIVLAGLR